jgi:hypothetical protein
VAERERLTKKERRARSREERRRKEAEQAARRKRERIRNSLVTFAVVAVVGAVVLSAFLGRTPSIDDTILISQAQADEAFDAAGCEVLADRQPLPERFHFDANQAPPLDSIYPDVRPTHSGPHTAGTATVRSASSTQLDEEVTTHNLEHGSVIAWWDPEQVDGSTASDIGDWAETLNENGFRNDRGGVGIMSSPYEDPGISSGKAVALRAWGTAWDCDQWDETVGHAFVIENFGTHGIGPERTLAPYPTDVLAYDDRDVEDTPEDEAPTGDRDHLEDPDDGDPTEDDGSPEDEGS